MGVKNKDGRKHERFHFGIAYRYAPETFQASYYGRRADGKYGFVPLARRYDELIRGNLGYMLITRGKKAVEDELKRTLRKKRREDHGKTAGYTIAYEYAENRRRYAFIREVYFEPGASLAERLWVYKEVKRYFADVMNWKIKSYTRAEFGKDFQIENVKEVMEKLNPEKPFILRLACE